MYIYIYIYIYVGICIYTGRGKPAGRRGSEERKCSTKLYWMSEARKSCAAQRVSNWVPLQPSGCLVQGSFSSNIQKREREKERERERERARER